MDANIDPETTIYLCIDRINYLGVLLQLFLDTL